jgi:hypothetical protein
MNILLPKFLKKKLKLYNIGKKHKYFSTKEKYLNKILAFYAFIKPETNLVKQTIITTSL